MSNSHSFISQLGATEQQWVWASDFGIADENKQKCKCPDAWWHLPNIHGELEHAKVAALGKQLLSLLKYVLESFLQLLLFLQNSSFVKGHVLCHVDAMHLCPRPIILWQFESTLALSASSQLQFPYFVCSCPFSLPVHVHLQATKHGIIRQFKLSTPFGALPKFSIWSLWTCIWSVSVLGLECLMDGGWSAVSECFCTQFGDGGRKSKI